MGFRQGDALGKQTATHGLGAHHHDRLTPLDDDLGPGAHPRQHGGEVAGDFRFRHVDDVLLHRQNYISTPRYFSIISRRTPRLGGYISFFNSASKFSASSGVSRFKSTSRSFSSTGCESGVKMVNCTGRSGSVDLPGVRWPESRCSDDSCSASTSRARTTTSFGNPASFATSIP